MRKSKDRNESNQFTKHFSGKIRYAAAALCILLTFSLAACGDASGNKDAEANKDSAKSKLTPVTVVLDYTPNTNHTGLYAALDLGYYEDAGLDVEIIEPADGTTATLIAAGKGDFGISYQEDVLYALTAETPLPIKAIATVIQHNTSGFATHKDKNITSPKDFEGKVYAGWGAPSEEAVIQAVMKSAGADPEKISIVTSDGTGYSVLADKVDIMWFFWAWDGIASQIDGMPINYMELKELDPRLDYYTPVIIANDSTIADKPEMVQKFINATKKGYEYCIEDYEGAAEIIKKHAPTYDLTMLTQSQEYLKDKYSEDSPEWGLMKDSVWKGYAEFMVEYGLIEKTVAPEDCYTNAFLE